MSSRTGSERNNWVAEEEEEDQEEEDENKAWQKLPIITFQTFDNLTGSDRWKLYGVGVALWWLVLFFVRCLWVDCLPASSV